MKNYHGSHVVHVVVVVVSTSQRRESPQRSFSAGRKGSVAGGESSRWNGTARLGGDVYLYLRAGWESISPRKERLEVQADQATDKSTVPACAKYHRTGIDFASNP
jgi:hypothetical protein